MREVRGHEGMSEDASDSRIAVHAVEDRKAEEGAAKELQESDVQDRRRRASIGQQLVGSKQERQRSGEVDGGADDQQEARSWIHGMSIGLRKVRSLCSARGGQEAVLQSRLE
jgi:hypothetical protein